MFRNVKRRNDYMPYGKDWAECPRCGKRAKNKDKIEEWFGYREIWVMEGIFLNHIVETVG